MKIHHLLGELKPSGAETMLKTASRLWRSGGCEGHVVATGAQTGPFERELREAGYTIHHLPFGNSPARWGAAYLRFLAREKPDVVHVHAEKNSLITTTIPRLLGIPVCRTIHNTFHYPGLLAWRKRVERGLSRLSGCVPISIGSSVRENELNTLGNGTLLLWDWYDEENFRLPTPEERLAARRDLGIGEGTITLLSLGNGNDVKNYASILGALALLSGRGSAAGAQPQGSTIRYLMVGREHPEALERTTAARLGVSDLVTFCGPRTDVRKYLWAADIFVMPSLYEGLGIAAIEAMATGIPTVLADVAGLRDFREFVLPVEWCSTDPSGIAGALERLMAANGDFARNPSMAQVVRERFSSGTNAPEYMKLWREIHA